MQICRRRPRRLRCTMRVHLDGPRLQGTQCIVSVLSPALFRIIHYFKTNTFERRPVVFGVFTCAHAHAHIHHADIQTDVLTRPVMMCGAVKPGGCWNTQVLIHYWKRKTKKHHFTLHPNMGTLLASSCCWLTARIPTRKMWAGRCLRT